MAATRTVKMQGTFEIINAANISETKKTTQDSKDVTEVTTTSPQVIAGLQTNVPLPMGGVTLAKRVFLRTDQEVTLKIGVSTDTGFKFGPGDGQWSSTSGIPGVFITTGPNATSVESVIAGD